MKTTARGSLAENKVAKHLIGQGYELLGQNWKTKICEIDLIMRKDGIVYFVEVKYRGSAAQGSGLDYLTAKKLKQIEFAARLWVQQNRWAGDWRLAAAAVSGPAYGIELIELG